MSAPSLEPDDSAEQRQINIAAEPPGDAQAHVLRVQHITRYRYRHPTVQSYNQAWLRPRDSFGQQVLDFRLKVTPRPQRLLAEEDHFGNLTHYIEIQRSHELLTVIAESRVCTTAPPLQGLGTAEWETYRFSELPPSSLRTFASRFSFPSSYLMASAEMRAYALASFTPGQSLRMALASLGSRLHQDFRYASGSTAIDTPLETVWATREGVCQDFAHLMLAMLHQLGLPVAYVSGYLMTHPPAGQARLIGADASHAWIGVLANDQQWLFYDPTNDCWAGRDHVIVAIGRSYHDIPPLKGISYSSEILQPEVEVTVEPLSASASAAQTHSDKLE